MVTEVTVKLQINKPVENVFAAIVEREKIGNFWFSSSSENWAQGHTVILKYNEYKAEAAIRLLEILNNEKIVFAWGAEREETIVTIKLREHEQTNTIMEVRESGFKPEDPCLLKNCSAKRKAGFTPLPA